MLKFEFSEEFQLEVIRFILKDRDGIKAFKLVKEEYFEFLNHAVLIRAISNFHRKLGRVPGELMLLEELRDLFKTQEFHEALSEKDKEGLTALSKEIFKKPVQDGDVLIQKVAKFASYAKMKDVVENVDLENYDTYSNFSSKVQDALALTRIDNEDKGTLLLSEIRDRQLKRRYKSSVIPTPFRQINKLTNAGGYSEGSIIVILDKPKNLKTAFLINWARGYLRMKKNVFYVDFENGQEEITTRLEQSLAGVNKKTIVEGLEDKKVQKVMRRYKRLGGEILIRRLPAFSTVFDIQAEMDLIYKSEGIRFHVLVIDYAGLMGSTTRKLDDKDRISDAYLDLANLANKNKIEHVITAHHITREGEKREATKYKDIDIAKCIDIVRHAQAIYGLNRTEEEKENDIIRAEIVAQRDGVPVGRALFFGDIEVQRMEEFTNQQIQEYEHLHETSQRIQD
jgi:replicative DNA helicase